MSAEPEEATTAITAGQREARKGEESVKEAARRGDKLTQNFKKLHTDDFSFQRKNVHSIK
jgi:hypothetical protein